MASLDFLLLLMLFPPIFSIATSVHHHGDIGFEVTLNRIDANTAYTKPQLLSRAVRRSRARAAALQAMAAAAPPDPITASRVLLRASEGEYLMDLAIGTPPKYYSAILDTGSDLMWTQCAPCLLCVEQPTPYFDPALSATFRGAPCTSRACKALAYPECFREVCVYQYSYGDSASTAGVLAYEAFTFGASKRTRVMVPKLAFGCGNINGGSLANGSGMVGFGRGQLSLVSQLGAHRFSYCLTSFLSATPSRLYFGSSATLDNTNASSDSPVQSTPLVINPALPSLYYLSLWGISVGASLLRINASVFDIAADGTGGVIIDSGTSITYLQQGAFEPLRQALVSLLQLPVVENTTTGLDTCFPWPPSPDANVTMPDVVFHFSRGANMTLPPENYLLIDAGTGNLCLAMVPSSDGSIIGGFQQQNMRVLYDLANGLLSFVPAPCNLI